MADDKQPEFRRVWTGFADEPEALIATLQAGGSEVLMLPAEKPWEAPQPGDLVLLSVDWPHFNPFLLCSRLKGPRMPWICTVLLYERGEEAPWIEPISQFCMADGLLHYERGKAEGDETLELLFSVLRRPSPRESTDVLLARLEGRIGGDASELAEKVRTGLSSERGRHFLDSVTDPDTGLYANAFMAFKLEEEFKRSWRFRLPLSVVLLDFPKLREIDEADRKGPLGLVSGRLLTECRDIDFMGRYDDSSFLLLLPSTGLLGAKVLVHRLTGELATIGDPALEDPAMALATVPKSGIESKDALLDLLRMTLVQAWTGEGEGRVQVAV